MIVQEIFPGDRSHEFEPSETPLSAFSTWYPRIAGARYNYVIDSHPVQLQNSDTITNKLDRFVLTVIRSSCDLIITTGKTARAEGLNASRYAPLAIITRDPDSLDIPATRMNSDLPVLICSTVQMTFTYTNSSLKFLPLESADLPTCLSEVVKHVHAKSPVIETGILSAIELVQAGMLEEICLTVVDAKSSTEATNIADSFLYEVGARAELLQLLQSDETFLFRFKVSK